MIDVTQTMKEPTTRAERSAVRRMKHDMKALRAILVQSEKRETKQRERADRLERAIKEHYRQVHAGNWGHDDELWTAVGLVADETVIG
jgi:hypothetical protein